jgi:two-component SAPR family response regulator
MIRLMAAARATLVLAAWLLGVPAMLVAIAGSPIPAALPTAAQAQAWLDDPLNPAYQHKTVEILAWTVWGLITIAILAALVHQLRALRWARVISYLPPPAQSLAAAILGTAVVATATSPLVTAPAAASAGTSDLKDLESAHTTLSARGSTHAAATRAAPATGNACRVVRGDNLWDLAATHLGDSHRWREIYNLNRGHVQANGYAMSDPDKIDVGWILALPSQHPGARPADPPDTPPPATPQASPPASPGSDRAAPSASTSPTVGSRDRAGDGVHAPPSRPSSIAPSTAHASGGGPANPPASGTTPPAVDAHREPKAPSPGPLDGVNIPGGWITPGLAGALIAAVGIVWRRRRHRHQPTPITSPRLDDADLLPPLAAMTRIRTSLRRTAPETLDEQPTPAPTVRQYRTAVVKPELPPVGPSGSDLAGAAALPLTTGLGLTGDGALDAARGLLVATLAAGSDNDADAKGRAIISAATLATLLGVSAVDLGHLDRLTVTASDADAITQLEEEIIRRSRLLADAQAADVGTLRDTNVHAEPLPQLLLIAEPPGPAWSSRLVTAIRLGRSVDIGAAVIGDWPTGTTLTVAADGTTGNDHTPRLAVLDAAATADMLGVLREAHGDGPAHAESPVHPRTAAEPEQVEPTPATTITAPPATAAADNAGRLPVAVRVLGRAAVLDHDGQPSPGIRSKAIELLVYLAVNRHGADLTDIMEALFPDANMRRAKERLSTVTADLRKHIRQAAAPAGTDQPGRQRLEPIPNTGSRYHLDPAIVSVDWWTVLDRYEATAAATDDEQRLSHLTAAIEAAGGGLAEGADYDWIDTDREVVRRHRIKLHAHAATLLADTDPHRSWLLLEQACQIDPLSDELARTTMRAAATLGDADAIRHRLTTLRDALDAHGLELSDETEALATELLRQLRPPPPSE